MKHKFALPLLLCLLVGLSATVAGAQQKRAIAFDDLASFDRISEPAISPDGRWVAYTLAQPDLAANRFSQNVWIVSALGDSGPRQITSTGSNSRPQWSPDSNKLAFLSDRGGAAQVYVLTMAGGEAQPVTHLSTGADNESWSPDGQSIAFTSGVYPDCSDDACNRRRGPNDGRSASPG